MKTVRKLMNAGDFAAAAERLRARLALSPGDEESKLMLGTCLHLLGDDEAFMRIDDELSRSPTARTLPAWPKFHALRAAACDFYIHPLASLRLCMISFVKSAVSSSPETVVFCLFTENCGMKALRA